VWRRERFFPGWNPDTKEEHRWRRLEWKWAFYNLLGNAILTAPIHHGIVTGKSRVYFDVAEHGGWGWLVASVFVVLAITEPLVYWAHRLLHHPFLYKRLHLPHHQFRQPSPWTSMAFHPLDSFAQAAPHHLLAYVLPLHVGVYAFFIMFLQVWSTFIHERVTWVRSPLVNFTAHHTLHHKLNKSNYGQFLTICDRVFGTYKAPDGIVYDGAERALFHTAASAAPVAEGAE
jgi:lathosterol oxidase